MTGDTASANTSSSPGHSALRQIFDDGYYRHEAAKRSLSVGDALAHFLGVGWRMGLNPCALFDVQYYLAQNPDAAASELNPLIHYLAIGAKKGARFSPDLEPASYVRQNPAAALNTLLHYRAQKALHSTTSTPPTDHPDKIEPIAPNTQKRAQGAQYELRQATPPSPRNPFFRLIGDQLSESPDAKFAIEYTTDWHRLRRKSSSPAVVHFHQLDPFYHKGDRTAEALRSRADALISELRLIKENGHRIVITKHNPIPHDRDFAELDLVVERRALELADCVIVFSEHARHTILSDLPKAKVQHIPHPSFPICRPISKRHARDELGLSQDRKIVGAIGELKEYKGIEFLLEAARHLPDVDFVFGGFPASGSYVDNLRRRLGDNVKLIPRDMADSEVSTWIAAFDASVFAFRDIWVSGSVLLSISHNTPVIAPDVGFLHEYVADDNTGFLYRPGEVRSFMYELQRFFGSPYKEHYRYMCRAWAKTHAPSIISQKYSALYTQVLEAP